MQWGIYDTQDDCWMGNEGGPKLFDERWLADVAAQVTADQLGHSFMRYEPREFIPAPMRLKDQVDTKRSPLEALMRIEDEKTH